jgi:hypothetical protein
MAINIFRSDRQDGFTQSYLAEANHLFCITNKDIFDSVGIRYTQKYYYCKCNLHDLIEKVFLVNNIDVIIDLNDISQRLKNYDFIMRINVLAVRYSSIETIEFLINKYKFRIDRKFRADALKLAAEREDDNMEIVKLIYDSSIHNNDLNDATNNSIKCNNHSIFKFLFKQLSIFHISFCTLKKNMDFSRNR